MMIVRDENILEKDDILYENIEEEISQAPFDLSYDKTNVIFHENDLEPKDNDKDMDIESQEDILRYFIQDYKPEKKSMTKNNSTTKTNTGFGGFPKKLKRIFNISKVNRKLGRIPILTYQKKTIVGKHDKFAQDNIIQKIKVNFHENIYILINKQYENYLESKGETDNITIIKLIRKISPKEIKKIRKDDNLRWFSSKLKDVFSFEISSKYNKYDKNYNKRQIESLYKENKAKNVINILEKSVRDMFYIYCNDISFDGFKTLKDDLVDLRIKMGRNEEEPFIQKYLDKYKEICCNLENIFLKKTSRKKNQAKL